MTAQSRLGFMVWLTKNTFFQDSFEPLKKRRLNDALQTVNQSLWVHNLWTMNCVTQKFFSMPLSLIDYHDSYQTYYVIRWTLVKISTVFYCKFIEFFKVLRNFENYFFMLSRGRSVNNPSKSSLVYAWSFKVIKRVRVFFSIDSFSAKYFKKFH